MELLSTWRQRIRQFTVLERVIGDSESEAAVETPYQKSEQQTLYEACRQQIKRMDYVLDASSPELLCCKLQNTSESVYQRWSAARKALLEKQLDAAKALAGKKIEKYLQEWRTFANSLRDEQAEREQIAQQRAEEGEQYFKYSQEFTRVNLSSRPKASALHTTSLSAYQEQPTYRESSTLGLSTATSYGRDYATSEHTNVRSLSIEAASTELRIGAETELEITLRDMNNQIYRPASAIDCEVEVEGAGRLISQAGKAAGSKLTIRITDGHATLQYRADQSSRPVKIKAHLKEYSEIRGEVTLQIKPSDSYGQR